jgi:flavin-dependent dehydrogenase
MDSARGESFARFPRLDGLPDDRYDVAILGGGLAGLTLALQLVKARPGTKVLVAEKRDGPAPEAAFKVGESTVEPGAHYFGDMLGLKDHIEQHQLRKFGLRFFCPAGGNQDISRRVEVGPPFHMPVPSYQLDRGRFENELLRRNVLAGIHAFDGCRVESVELAEGDGEHRVTVSRDEGEATVSARWVIDATGRKSTLKKKLDLAEEVDHKINSVWFRLDGGLNVEDFSDDPDWLDRMEQRGMRQYSTSHLMGHGYWLWLINLASGPISIGICADPRAHPFETMSDMDRTLEWLREHEPQVAAVVDSRGPEAIADFLTVKSFSLGCKRVFSPERWCLTGEAGCFLDPLCSPGSDFIAYSNSLIADCVVRDLNGEDVGDRIEAFNDFYLLAFRTVLKAYTDSYPLLGDALTFAPKFIVNAIMYWGVWSLLFFKEKMWDYEFQLAIRDDLDRIERLYTRMEQLFRDWYGLAERREWTGIWLSPPTVGPLRERVQDLATERSDEELRQRFSDNVKVYEALAVTMFDKAARLLPDAPAWEDRKINPYAISLDPGRWEQLPGIENVWMDQRVAVG